MEQNNDSQLFTDFKIIKNRLFLQSDFFLYVGISAVAAAAITITAIQVSTGVFYPDGTLTNFLKSMFSFGDSVTLHNITVDGEFYESVDVAKDVAKNYFGNKLSESFAKIAFGFFVFTVAYFMPFFYLLKKAIKKGSDELHKDEILVGTKVLEKDEYLKEQKEKNIKGINLTKEHIFDENMLTKHAFIAGSTGAGKSVFLKNIINFISKSSNPKFKKARMLIHDIKGDYVEQFYNELTDIILNPLDKRSKKINVFTLIKRTVKLEKLVNGIPTEVYEKKILRSGIAKLCTSLIPESKKSEPIWVNSARDLLEAIIYSCIAQKTMTNEAIKRHINMDIGTLAKTLKNVKGAESGYSHIAAYANSSQPANIFSNFKVYMNFFNYLEENDNEELDLEEWIKNGTGKIFLANYAEIQDIVAPFLALIVDYVASEVITLPEDQDRRIFFFIDEFRSLSKNKIDGILKFLTLARSFGGSLFLGIQEIGQLEEIYGKELRQAILNNTATKVLFLTGETETAKYLSEMIGNQEIRYSSKTYTLGTHEEKDSQGLNSAIRTRPAVMPELFQSLPENTYYFFQRGRSWTKIKYDFDINVDVYPKIAEKIVWNENFFINEDDEISEDENFYKDDELDVVNEIETDDFIPEEIIEEKKETPFY